MDVPEDKFAPSLPRPCHRAHDFFESFQRFKRWQGHQTHARLRCQGRATKSDRAGIERLKRAHVEASYAITRDGLDALAASIE
jgi:hypothetical protein